jgi:hypothetical protein
VCVCVLHLISYQYHLLSIYIKGGGEKLFPDACGERWKKLFRPPTHLDFDSHDDGFNNNMKKKKNVLQFIDPLNGIPLRTRAMVVQDSVSTHLLLSLHISLTHDSLSHDSLSLSLLVTLSIYLFSEMFSLFLSRYLWHSNLSLTNCLPTHPHTHIQEPSHTVLTSLPSTIEIQDTLCNIKEGDFLSCRSRVAFRFSK